MTNPNKVILTDVDGVLLDWEYAFGVWMARNGFEAVVPNVYDMALKYDMEKAECKKLIRQFNESAWIEKLGPLRDAIKYVKKIHEECGYVFHVITSLSNDPYAQELRTKNLKNVFGDTIFEKFVYLDTGEDKDEALEPYRDSGCVWVEDKPENAMVGYNMGLNAILMGHDHNELQAGECARVNCWKDIYEMVK